MTAVDAFLNWSPFDNWPTKTGPAKNVPPVPLDGIGVRLAAGSWARFDAWLGTTTVAVFPSPAAWEMPGMWGTVAMWAGRKTPTATPVRLPWAPGWKGPGGFTDQLDNGIMVDTTLERSEGWEILGMRKANDVDRFLINWRLIVDGLAKPGTEPAKAGCYVADRINQRRPGVAPKGAQGPWWWQEGVLTPEMLRGGAWNGPLRIGVHNLAFGPTATAAPGAWVEHPDPGQPYGPSHPILYPTDNPPDRMLPCGQEFEVSIDDARIGRWLDDQRVPRGELRTTKGMFAEGLAREGMRIMLSVTATPHAIALSSVNPATAAAWAAIGVTSDTVGRQLGAGLFRYATLGAVS